MFAMAMTYLVLVTSCTQPIEYVEMPATPKPAKPVPTPHPAVAAKLVAKRLYPDLEEKGSEFHTAFVERYEHQKATNPRLLTELNWPVDIAHQTARLLGVEPKSLNPVATPAPSTPAPPASSLSRGAYDQRRGVVRKSVYIDQYGNRVYR